MVEKDIIIGLHSVKAALRNKLRKHIQLFATEDGKLELEKALNYKLNDQLEIKVYSSHKFQEVAKETFKKNGFLYSRVPGGLLLVSNQLEEYTNLELYDLLRCGQKKIVALDQVSDVHNGAAILRTCSFYGVDVLIVPSKKSFEFTPGYFRVASGAHEFVKILRVNSLPKVIQKLKSTNTLAIGLDEHSSKGLSMSDIKNKLNHDNVLLVLGKEETGISNAVRRTLDSTMSLLPQGETKSLNVSVASAIALEKCFGS